ncbi:MULTISPECIES: glycosyltransferase family 4 protein [unclassified Tolypothrix]|uniref:glycosyltransferase family 4 protein n=1 Tax=unclassified Tolypothrix TaxID=2649714 RepID=UPI0005EAAEA8|nr:MULTISPECIES: glycosyltransferase family 4 protein [unclassified Tolypothrix]BAY92046.1 lipopolysaccharide N-acetylglucosaminyltransferase [Microchaete diplosiphon NIES-3275]EKF04758.1 glycosyltransferase, group 1 family [Tolypothrix sp. PCC 7601]MBE9081749.1 glycosyltransferase family 4 protein [Tolypothrix sp. LEGE 11397]UYD26034.1 glycosyltransferase family 4 protein [Tolypothrix sp. PCC 7712]UYD31727.1 glycosyltransferase family 4 protein [Tolypothrix sp. PCC 7601]
MIINIATGPWLPVPAVQGGAIPRLWQGLAEEFAARGHQVSILCRSYPSQPHTEVINGVQYIRHGGFPQSTNITLDLLKDFFYSLLTFPRLPHADILVINDFWLPIFACLRPKAGKVVINANRFPKGQYWLYAGTSFFAVASQAIQEAIAKEYPAAISRMEIIPNPIDTRIFSPSTQPKLARKEKLILYVGRIHPEKGVHLLLDAFSILSQKISTVKLRIIGPIKENQGGGGDTYLRKLDAQSVGLSVEFLEPIFNIYKLAEAYREADIFCYPSLAEKGESFGVAPLEAMASGLVPVVSDLACFKDFIEDGKTGYFFNHRTVDAAKNLSDKLFSAIIDSDNNNTMSIQATQKAQEFNYEQVTQRYLADFEKILLFKNSSF